MAEVAVAQPALAGPPTNDENSAPATSEEIKTVFHDPSNFNVKHPLLHEWSLWVSILRTVHLTEADMCSSQSHLLPKATTGMIS
jgi:hypothetical protein